MNSNHPKNPKAHNDPSNPALPGRFHELEAISPRLDLKKGEEASLSSRLIFLSGERQKLEEIVRKMTGFEDLKLVA